MCEAELAEKNQKKGLVKEDQKENWIKEDYVLVDIKKKKKKE